jgi:hypothetical protein
MADLVAEPAPGYRVIGAGLNGTVTAYEPAEAGVTRGGPLVDSAALDAALAETGVAEIKVLEVRADVEPGTAPPVRADRASGTLRVEVPDLGAGTGQVVLATDPGGAMSWHFPVDRLGADATRGDGALVFDIPFRAEEVDAAEVADRGLVQVVTKALKVLVYDLVDPLLGAVGEHFARAWEEKHRPTRVRAFHPESFTDPGVPTLTPDEWRALDGQTALLFVHGTFSTAHGGFAGLPRDTLGELWRRYDGRVLAFDHATLSVDPAENLARFHESVPPGVDVTFDVVSHSRGGLVTRALAGELDRPLPGVTVRRAVLVGVPNGGTPLVDMKHMAGLLDRVTTGLNLLPPGPYSAAVEVLTAIVTVVKVVGSGVIGGLDGLQSMHRTGAFLGRLNAGAASAAEYYGVAAEFEPTGGFKSLVVGTVPDAVMDIVFGPDANDLVVPTLGVGDGDGDPSFPIRPDRLHSFGRTRGVWHCNYFNQPDTTARLLDWLPGGA